MLNADRKNFFTIRPVNDTASDLETLSRFCHGLAEYDGYKASMDAEKLGRTLFYTGTNVRAFFGCRDGEPIGFILAYECFTVYHGDRGLYVCGAYIIPKYRHKGYGVKLARFLTQYALAHGFDFMNWIVEGRNKNAKDLYRKIGASMSDDWTYVRLSRQVMDRLTEK